MKAITLHQLQIFEVAARHLSFTRAAEELYLTQPTISMQIKQLSKSVGLPLFEQVGKRLYLTEAGQALYQTCQKIFEQLNQFEMTLADLKGLKQGRLSIGVVTTAKYFIPRLLGLFCQQYPGIDVSLKVLNRQQVLEGLSNNMDDLYVMGMPPEDLDVVAQPFLENPLVVMAPIHHPLVGQKRIPLARIAQEPFLAREPGSGTRMAVERLFDKHNLKLNIRMEIGSSEAIRQGIIGGLGISVLSQHVLALGDWQHHLAILDVEEFPIRGFWHLVYLRSKRLSVVAKAFADFLLSQVSQMDLDLPPKELHRANSNPNPDWLSGKGDRLQPPALVSTPGGPEYHG
ncbi:LysR substrate-binding domain-containing protein [Synechococcus sp. OH2]|uniref:LysR family transcriptional regulator n=1 Tax=Synechococcus sp. OH2 TaxID=136798 RepID=UPI0039C4C503